MNRQEPEPSPEQRVAWGTAHRVKQRLVPRWFKALLWMAFPCGVAHQLAGIVWATAVAVVVALVFTAIMIALDASRDRL